MTGIRAGLTSTSSRPDPRRPRRRRTRPYRPRELRDARLTPERSLGQHFLTDYGVVNRIVAAARLSQDDTVIEVGPGTGVLTQALAVAAGRVVALELDRELAERLREQVASQSHITVVQGDATQETPEALLAAAGLSPATPYVVAGNLPYNAGTAIVRRFLEAGHPPSRLIVMLQREVADSMAAREGDMGLLAVSVRVYAEVRKLFNVPARSFYPQPRVTSAVVRLETRPKALVPPAERERFFRVLRAGFSAPRKQLRNTLAQGLQLPAAEVARSVEAEGLAPTQRPQQLSIDGWLRLSRRLGQAG